MAKLKQTFNIQKETKLELDRLVDPKAEDLDKDLLCQICMDIVQDPQECSVCQNVYCLDCINDWKKAKNQCPNQCKGKWKLQPPHKKYKQSLAELKFKCKFANKGCDSLVTIDNYQNHESKCAHNDKPKNNDKEESKTKDNDQKSDQSDIESNVRWCFQGDNGKWQTYEQKVSDEIEKNYQKKNQVFQKRIGTWDYDIDLQQLLQINKTTLKNRKITRKLLKQPQNEQQIPQKQPKKEEKQDQKEEEDEKEYLWYWLDKDHGKNDWNEYNSEIGKKIEEAYKNYLENKRRKIFKFEMRNMVYEINFETKTQKNVATKYERDVDRKEAQ